LEITPKASRYEKSPDIFSPFALMTTAYPFNYVVSAEPLSRSGPVDSILLE